MKSEKYCKRCDQILSIDLFTRAAKRSDGVQSYCRECMKKYRIEHYQRNKESYYKRNKATLRKLANFIKEAKAVPCRDCHIEYPYYVMDFDHRDPSTKRNNIGDLIKCGSLSRLKEEMKKCDIVCSNCHRERTAHMFNYALPIERHAHE